MSTSNNVYLPQISSEAIEEIKVYQSKNKPLEVASSSDNKLRQKKYRDGVVVIQTVEGDIIDCYKMPDDELKKMIIRYDEACEILKHVSESARKLRSTGIK